MDIFGQYKNRIPEEFQRLVGVSKGTYLVLLDKFVNEIAVYKDELWTRKLGNKSSISIDNKLLIYLLHLRNYDTYLNLGMKFGISESYAYKRCKFAEKILLRCLDCPDVDCLKTSIESNLIAVDVCEQEIERPLEGQKEYYSGKKRHTVKVFIVACVLTGLIKGIWYAKGAVHDFKMLKDKNPELAKDITILADLGFLGIQHIYNKCIIPHKKSKNKPLTQEQKEDNKRQASKRVVVEHLNRCCKIFRICSSRFRGKHKNYDKNWGNISAIVNLKKATNHMKYTEF